MDNPKLTEEEEAMLDRLMLNSEQIPFHLKNQEYLEKLRAQRNKSEDEKMLDRIMQYITP